jgi:hypothetical protein
MTKPTISRPWLMSLRAHGEPDGLVLASSSSSTQVMSGCAQVHRIAWTGQLRIAATSSMLLPEARYRRARRSSFVSGIDMMRVLSAESSMAACTIALQPPACRQITKTSLSAEKGATPIGR